MRVLITGNLGYIGRVTAQRIFAAGMETFGLDCGLYRSGTDASAPEIPTLFKDVRDVEGVDLAGMDAVVHLAALSNDPLGDIDAALTDEINHVATVRLAELAKRAGVRRLVFASTCSVYGAAGRDEVDEEGAVDPKTAYAASKLRAEDGLLRLADRAFCPVILRLATAYGPSPSQRLDVVLNNLMGHAVARGVVQLRSDGMAWRPLVHVNDIACGFLAALEIEESRVRGRVINVGRRDGNHRVRELAAFAAEAVPEARIHHQHPTLADPRSYRVRFDRLSECMAGFEPVYDARQGAAELAAALGNLGLTADQVDGPEYNRVGRLTQRLCDGVLDADLRWARRPLVLRASGGEP